MDQNRAEVEKVRLFVGGLSSEVSSVDLKERFTPLGTVLSVTTPPAKYGSGPHRGFAYVGFLPTSEASLRKLFSAYNGCKWRGGVLRIEVAKEHYIDKLQKEWAAEAEALAAMEEERLRKKIDVHAVSAAKHAKSWPLLLLEQPENPDRWKKKRNVEQGAEGDGIKIFFPRLKKVKSVPSRGLGKHKRSFQRVESIPLQQLSTCDCDEGLRTGSCDCSTTQPFADDARDDLVTNGEDDPVSLAIAKERQGQLDLVNKLFPSDSPRNSEPANELTTLSGKLFLKVEEETGEDPQANEFSVPKGNELTRARWKSLVGETGRVAFSLQQVLGGKSSHVTPETDDPPTAEDPHMEETFGISDISQEKNVVNISPAITQTGEKKLLTKKTQKTSLRPGKEVLELDDRPLIPVFTDDKVCPFMKSPDAEKEWLATKSELRANYRSKHKQALKKSRKLRSR